MRQTQQATPYVVGQLYPVREVHGRLFNKVAWWPVMGELHNDTEIINFRALHFHIDWRFVNARVYGMKRMGSYYPGDSARLHYGIPLCMNSTGKGLARDNFETRVRRLKCRRERQPYIHGAANWQTALTEAHAQSCLKRGICPHRGYDLSSETPVDGIVTCPLHGLRWHVDTGRIYTPPSPARTSFEAHVAAQESNA